MRRAKLRPVGARVESEDAHRSGVRRAVALQRLDGRRLAGAVRPEQAEHLAPRDAQGETVNRAAIAVTHLEPGDFDRPLGSAIHRSVSLSAGTAAPRLVRAGNSSAFSARSGPFGEPQGAEDGELPVAPGDEPAELGERFFASSVIGT